MKRTYENEALKVFWDSEKCTHSAICTNGLPGVFNVMKTPWVNINGATAKDIMRVVDACPSGALRYEVAGEPMRQSKDSTPVTVVVSDNGPYIIKGKCRLVASGGREITSGDKLCLCRCGQSRKMPFCDGTHQQVGFKDPDQSDDAKPDHLHKSDKTQT